MSAIPLQRDIHYPESDGQPMAESDLHRDVMIELIGGLKRRFRNVRDVYVGGNLLFYYIEGDPRRSFSPDVFVVRGVPKGRRRIYQLWKEGRPPCFVIEVTSDTTRTEDVARKKALYEELGVEEYFLFDPEGDYLRPRLQGYRLEAGRYAPLQPALDGSLASRTTGLKLRPEGERLRLVDLATGEPLAWSEEVEDRLQRSEEEVARLRRELERRGG